MEIVVAFILLLFLGFAIAHPSQQGGGITAALFVSGLLFLGYLAQKFPLIGYVLGVILVLGFLGVVVFSLASPLFKTLTVTDRVVGFAQGVFLLGLAVYAVYTGVVVVHSFP